MPYIILGEDGTLQTDFSAQGMESHQQLHRKQITYHINSKQKDHITSILGEIKETLVSDIRSACPIPFLKTAMPQQVQPELDSCFLAVVSSRADGVGFLSNQSQRKGSPDYLLICKDPEILCLIHVIGVFTMYVLLYWKSRELGTRLILQ